MRNSRWETHPIYVEPYKYKVHLVVGEKEWNSFCALTGVARDVKGIEGLAWGLEEADSGATFSVLYIGGRSPNYGIIVHECVHIIHEMLEDRGVPLSHDNTEVMAYHIEHLFNQVLEELRKRRVSLDASA